MSNASVFGRAVVHELGPRLVQTASMRWQAPISFDLFLPHWGSW
jgi:hypothetical protein